MGSKKYTRDVSEVTAGLWVQRNVSAKVFGYSLCLRVQKCTRNIIEVVTLFMGSKECIREGAWLLFAFVGS